MEYEEYVKLTPEQYRVFLMTATLGDMVELVASMQRIISEQEKIIATAEIGV